MPSRDTLALLGVLLIVAVEACGASTQQQFDVLAALWAHGVAHNIDVNTLVGATAFALHSNHTTADEMRDWVRSIADSQVSTSCHCCYFITEYFRLYRHS